jgi:hypothetical protein
LYIIDQSQDNVEIARKSTSLESSEVISVFSDECSSGRKHVFTIVKNSKTTLDKNGNWQVAYIFEAFNSADKKEWLDRIHHQIILLSPNLQFLIPGSPTENKDNKEINNKKLSTSWDSDNSSDDIDTSSTRNRTKSNINNLEDELLYALEEARNCTNETKLAIKEVILEFKKRNTQTFEITQQEKKSVKCSNCCIII